ncbi:enoyl-CoA hydratase/isomerase family protein [Rhodoferax antarcticus]|uniref:Enoyl-CoA hydratase/isomerase n=1 Tax=Rhodoferax antarcticus ANT.BR TaxID=1111071 RepID=A0A1Q8YB52_9BURK|nr:enoyl-CoA hydratase/isomerase family protein [Rhodoferax antarcticus]APW46743.1 3-hydroxyisobutyryl-CoA hydrolase [Rhodoferax antarcticus]OLP05213.1 Enoyl-CoA hydratase/isomerase [Rhodoferax antarcticus ANT.BR]
MSAVVNEVLTEIRGQVGFITLNRPAALNALTLQMIRALTTCLLAWREDARVQAVAIRGSNKAGPFGAFCAGGDIRFFHQALLSGDPSPEDFFTEEYTLNHLIHTYPKPYMAFMDGVVMGGGMGISQGASHRLVTARSKIAMPETTIGLFPDVAGGYFLSRCPGHTGEWLALTGTTLTAAQAIAMGLADHCLEVDQQAAAWDALGQIDLGQSLQLSDWIATYCIAISAEDIRARGQIDHYFSMDGVVSIVQALEADNADWAQQTAAQLRQRSPLMLHLTLAQIRRARHMSLAEDLRMERDMVRHCFFPRHLRRSAAQTETAEGIRALAVDKDNTPHWQPACIEDVTPDMVLAFFDSPWAAHCHPLCDLA